MKWKFPISPVAASRPRVSRWGTYFTGTYKDFRAAAKPIIEAVTKGHTPTESKLQVIVGIYPTKPKTSKLKYPRPDVDNYIKAILDLCNGVIWDDDSQIVYLEATKEWATKDGYFTVEIKEMK
jgi:Holliday junction resolvase RusA-like endonuclease